MKKPKTITMAIIDPKEDEALPTLEIRSGKEKVSMWITSLQKVELSKLGVKTEEEK